MRRSRRPRGVQIPDWAFELSDRWIAQLYDVSESIVAYHRKKQNMPPSARKADTKNLKTPWDKLTPALGVLSDEEMARALRLNRGTVREARLRRKIPLNISGDRTAALELLREVAGEWATSHNPEQDGLRDAESTEDLLRKLKQALQQDNSHLCRLLTDALRRRGLIE